MQPQPALLSEESITTPVTDAPQRLVWPATLRIAFRFLFAYFVLYNLPASSGHINLINTIPGGFFLSQWYARPWHALVPWVATHLFHVTGRAATYFPTGSGDTTKDYVMEFCFLVIAAVATLIWSMLDRKRENYRTLYCWLRWLMRYTLAFTLFGYGFAKVFPLQFSPPNFARLLERYGDFSPMGSLWWFMGASLPYIIFAGTAEVIPGILLLFRRTATLGAMLAFAVLSNVMVLNYCYDVPVKLYSTNLVLMSLFLIAPDLRRLARMLIFNQPTEPAELYSLCITRKWMRVTALAIAILVPGYALGQQAYGGWQGYKQRYLAAKPALYGLYEVELFSRNGADVPPMVTDSSRWRWLLFEFEGAASVVSMTDISTPYKAEIDTANSHVTLSPRNNANTRLEFRYAQSDPDHLQLASDGLSIALRRYDPQKKFLLLNRGFHWINENPLNR